MAFGDVVQSNSGTSTSATTSPTLGVGVTSGNLIVLTFAADDYNGSPNAGWTQSTNMEQQTFHGGYIWWFLASSNGQAIPSYTIASAVRSTWTLVEYAGPFNASPYDVSNGQNSTTAASSYTTPTITPTTGSRLLVGGLNAQHAASDLAAWGSYTNSFVESKASLFNGGNPRLTIAQVMRVVTGDGATGFSTGGSFGAQVAQSLSGLLIAFKAGSAAAAPFVTQQTETRAVAGRLNPGSTQAQPPELRNLDTQFRGPAQFESHDWPNPTLKLQHARGSQQAQPAYYVGTDRFFGGAGFAPDYELPNPPQPKRTHTGWVAASAAVLLATLAANVQSARAAQDLPLRPIVRQVGDVRSADIRLLAPVPFFGLSWPNPNRRPADPMVDATCGAVLSTLTPSPARGLVVLTAVQRASYW